MFFLEMALKNKTIELQNKAANSMSFEPNLSQGDLNNQDAKL